MLGPDPFVVYRGFTFLAEGYRRKRRESESTLEAWGAYAQTGYFVVPRRFELAARVGALDRDVHGPGGNLAIYEGAAHVYPLGNHLKVQLRYAHARGDTTLAEPAHRVTLQTQLYF